MAVEPGEIKTVTATMFGGKSVYALHLMETLSRCLEAHSVENKILYINHDLDKRMETEGSDTKTQAYSTHSEIIGPNVIINLKVDAIKRSDLQLDDDYIRRYRYVIIDEAQFFADLVVKSLHFAEVLGVNVYAVGLRTDSERNRFGKLGELADLADENIELKNTYCGFCASNGKMTKALFNHRTADNTHEQIQVGNDYVPACRKCYLINNPRRL